MLSSKWPIMAAAMFATGVMASSQHVCAQESTQPAATAAKPEGVARIAGKVVTEDELSSFALQLEMSEGRRVPSSEALLDEYILTQLYEQLPTTATAAAKAGAESPSPFDSVSQRAVLKRELRDEINANIDVPRPEMQEWYEANVGRYSKPERVHAWHLFLETSDEAETSSPEKVRTRLKELKAQVDAGTSFSETAEKYSEAASGKAGGEIGMITRRMPIGPLSKPMNVELEDVFFSLPVGKVSDVVETRHGMHLLYVTDKETTRVPTLDDMITSGILPGVLAQDRLTSEIRAVIAETVKKHNGEVLPGHNEGQELTTDTVAFRLAGKDYTVGNLKSVFGPRFSTYLDSAQRESSTLKDLMQQAMDDEAMVLAAVDRNLHKSSKVVGELQTLEKRAKAAEAIEAVVAAEARVTDAEIERKYNEIKEELRQPVAEGSILLIKSEQTSGTAEQARARETARRKAEEVRQQMESEDFDKIANQVKADGAVNVELSPVPEHVIGQTTDTESRIFDQAISGVTGAEGISQVVPMGADFAIAHLVRRGPGLPIPLDVIRDRLVQMLEGEAQLKVRAELVKQLADKGLVEYLSGAASYGKIAGSAPSDSQTTASH